MEPPRPPSKNAIWLVSRAQSAHEIDDNAYQQNETQPSSANGWTPKVETAATEQKKQDEYNQYKIHACRIALYCQWFHGVFPYLLTFSLLLSANRINTLPGSQLFAISTLPDFPGGCKLTVV